jgi:DNA-binding XRE family transcriptional regulator
MKQQIHKLDYFKFHHVKNVDNSVKIAGNSKNITLKALYCNPKIYTSNMYSATIEQIVPRKKDLRFKKNNIKQSWEISDVSDSQLWMQSRNFRVVIGLKIKTIREKQGISQMSLALRLGWDQGYQSRIEGGKVNLCLITLAKIAIVLNSAIKFEERDFDVL